MVDSSIELIAVIGKVPIVDTAYEVKNNTITRTRFDTVNAFMLEEKNLTKGTVDTIYIYYYNAAIWIFSFNIKVPLIEGTQNIYGQGSYSSTNIVNKNTSVIIFNKTYDNCIYYEDSFSSGWPSGINGIKNYRKIIDGHNNYLSLKNKLTNVLETAILEEKGFDIRN